MSKNKAKEIATEVFKANSFVEKVYVTSDNKPFTVISDAQNYASKKFDDSEGRKVQTFERETLGVVADAKKEVKVFQLIDKINSATSVEAVEELIQGEYRPIVLKRAESKVKELTPVAPKAPDNSDEIEGLKTANSTLKVDLDKATEAISKKDKALKAKDAAIKKLQEAAKKE